MPRTRRLILYVSVESLDGVTKLEPEGGWENHSLRCHIRVDCKKCNREILEIGHLPLYLYAGMMEDAQYHRALTCPKRMGNGGLRVLRRGGKPITDEGEEMAVLEIEVVGPFHVHKKIKLFYFWWMCRKDDGSGGLLGPFSVGKDGDCAFRVSADESDDEGELLEIKGIKGWFQVTPWEEEVVGLGIKEASRSSQASDSDSSSEDSDD
ncbi:hypothetical protein ACFX2I_004490 [Malus domestica]